MNQNKLLYNIVKIAKDIKITQEQLDEFLPTDFTATAGDILLPTTRVGRRSGRAKELANLAGIDTPDSNSWSLNHPLTTQLLSLPVLPVHIVINAIRHAKLRKIKKLIAQKGKINVPEDSDLVVAAPDELVNVGGTVFNKGRTSTRKFIAALSKGLSAKEADKLVNSDTSRQGAIESALDLAVPGGGLAYGFAKDRFADTKNKSDKKKKK